MAALLARDADIAHDATNPPTRREDSRALAPHFVQLNEKRFVVGDLTELALVRLVLLQCPVRRRRDDQVNAGVWNPRKITRIANA